MSLRNRVTDTHVREHLIELTPIALEFAQQYCGEFDVMIEAHNRFNAGSQFSISEIRTILNCLRAELNPRYGSLKIEAESVLAELAPVRPRPPHLHVVPLSAPPQPVEKPRPWSVEVPARIHMPFGAPKAQNGSLHVVQGGVVNWTFKGDNWRLPKHLQVNGPRRPILRVWWVCGKHVDNPLLVKTEDDLDRAYCRAGCWED